jgi:hypothetical protein
MSTIDKLGLPQEFGLTLLTLALIASLVPYASGADFGLLKVPRFESARRKRLMLIGPLLLGLSISLFIPFWAPVPEDAEAEVVDARSPAPGDDELSAFSGAPESTHVDSLPNNWKVIATSLIEGARDASLPGNGSLSVSGRLTSSGDLLFRIGANSCSRCDGRQKEVRLLDADGRTVRQLSVSLQPTAGSAWCGDRCIQVFRVPAGDVAHVSSLDWPRNVCFGPDELEDSDGPIGWDPKGSRCEAIK